MIAEWRLWSEWVFNLGGREDQVIVDVGGVKLTCRPSGELLLEIDGAGTLHSGRAGLSEVTAIIAEMPESALKAAGSLSLLLGHAANPSAAKRERENVENAISAPGPGCPRRCSARRCLGTPIGSPS